MNEKTLTTFRASYSWSGGWGAYEEIELIVVARDEQHARCLVENEYSDTRSQLWSFSEIDTSAAAVYYISNRSS